MVGRTGVEPAAPRSQSALSTVGLPPNIYWSRAVSELFIIFLQEQSHGWDNSYTLVRFSWHFSAITFNTPIASDTSRSAFTSVVQPQGIEPQPQDFQSRAPTTYARAAYKSKDNHSLELIRPSHRS